MPAPTLDDATETAARRLLLDPQVAFVFVGTVGVARADGAWECCVSMFGAAPTDAVVELVLRTLGACMRAQNTAPEAAAKSFADALVRHGLFFRTAPTPPPPAETA